MTTQTFIENATIYNYTIYDQDGHQFGLILANGYYGIKLNYSPTFQKKYFFKSTSNVFAIWMGTDGQISGLEANNVIYLMVKPEEYTARIHLFPPPLKTSKQVTNCRHLYGPCRNKLMITPSNNIFARIHPLVAPPVPDRVLRLDFTG